VENLRERALLGWCEAVTGHAQAALQPVSGDASFRRYFRASDGRQSVIAVDAPPNAEPLRPFVQIAEAYAAQGINVPEVFAFDEAKGFMLLSDLGSTLLLSKLSEQNATLYYQQAIKILPDIMRVTRVNDQPLPAYDEALLRREMALCSEWLFDQHLGITLTPAEQQLWQRTTDYLCQQALQQPQVGVHRDYHSRNLMVCDDGRLGVIDFQDAVRGPITYDLVSLVRDCYVAWPAARVTEWITFAYDELRRTEQLAATVSLAEFTQWADCMGAQRHLKAAGIFARLYHRDGKDGYLNDIPRTLNYIVTVARANPPLAEFGTWLAQRVIPALARP